MAIIIQGEARQDQELISLPSASHYSLGSVFWSTERQMYYVVIDCHELLGIPVKGDGSVYALNDEEIADREDVLVEYLPDANITITVDA